MNEKQKKIIFIVLGLMFGAIITLVGYYWYNNTNYISTEDARVTGDIAKVSPQITGKLLELNFEEGDTVQKDQILGRQEAVNLSDSGIETTIIRSPIDGIILKKQGLVGEIVSSGQTLGAIVDPDKLYISANIEETDIGRIKKGQAVDISIDQFEGKKLSGNVRSIGEASNSTFSILPTSNSTTFTKVVQKIPVKIEIGKNDIKLLPGTNAIIRIHIH